MSSNGWDLSSEKDFGFNTAWINRNNLPVEEIDISPKQIKYMENKMKKLDGIVYDYILIVALYFSSLIGFTLLLIV